MTTQSPVTTEHQQAAYHREFQLQPLTSKTLQQQNLAFQGTGGVSMNNRSQGFLPAFLDTVTGIIHLARFADGRLAPMHLIEGLPPELALKHDITGKCTAVKASVIAGFVRDNLFYTREQ